MSQPYVTPTVKRMKAVADRDGGWRCAYCGVGLVQRPVRLSNDDVVQAPTSDAVWAAPGLEFPTIDHVIARTNGGTNDLANLVLACGSCNSKKGAK